MFRRRRPGLLEKASGGEVGKKMGVSVGIVKTIGNEGQFKGALIKEFTEVTAECLLFNKTVSPGLPPGNVR